MTKVKIRILILIFLLEIFSVPLLRAQESGIPCGEIPNGFTFVDNLFLSGLDEINCSPGGRQILQLEGFGNISKAQVLFSKDSVFTDLPFDISKIDISSSGKVEFNFSDGKTWALITGDRGGKKIASCQSFEFLRNSQPMIDADLCTGDEINLKIIDPLDRELFKINWGDGNTEVVGAEKQSFNHHYSDYFKEITVSAFYLRDGEEICESKPAALKKNLPKPILMTSLEGLNDPTEVRITYTGGEPLKYDIEGNLEKGGWEKISEAEEGVGEVIGLELQKNYCFRIKTEDSCGDPFYSENTLCNIVIESEVVSNTAMDLNWNTPEYPDVLPEKMSFTKSQMDAVKNGVFHTDLSVYKNESWIEYHDDEVVCGKTYYYKVRADYPEQEFEGQKVPVWIQTAWVPHQLSEARVDQQPPYMALASFKEDNETRIELLIGANSDDLSKIDTFTYQILKSPNGEIVQSVDSDKPFYEFDVPSNTDSEYCFKYQFKDFCGILSAPSEVFCTVNLQRIHFDTLKWTVPEYNYPVQGLPLYTVEYSSDNDGFFNTGSVHYNENYTDIYDFLRLQQDPVVKFRIRVDQDINWSDNRLRSATIYSNSLEIRLPSEIFVPTAFTPNGSGPVKTENFRVFYKFIDSGYYQITDRSGNVLFKSENLDTVWDGKDQRTGRLMTPGTYYYQISAKGWDGIINQKKGTVALLW